VSPPSVDVRVALLADIHGNHCALSAVLDTLKRRVDRYLVAGDLCGYYPFVSECLSLWPESEMVGVRGNHDQVLLDAVQGIAVPGDYRKKYGSGLERALSRLSRPEIERLLALPDTQALSFGGARLRMYHGAPWDPFEGRVYPDFSAWERFSCVEADVIVLGHTHYPLVREYHGKLVINPGSVGQARNQSGVACCAVLDLESREVELVSVPYSPEDVIADVRRHDPHLPYLVDALTR